MKKGFWVSIIIIILVFLAGFSIGYFAFREANPVPIIIEKCPEAGFSN